jgi:protein TonB
MFKVLTGEKKRRVISPATLTASIAAHLVLLGGLVYASTGDGGVIEVVSTEMALPEYKEPEQPTPPQVDDPAPPPPPAVEDQPEEPQAPVAALEIPDVTEVPQVIKPEAPATPPIDPRDFERDGPRGPVITPPPPGGVPGGTETGQGTQPRGSNIVFDEKNVEELPVLEREGLGRTMERYYPSVLRDARISGRVLVEVIVDENGRARPGSARVIESSHPAFEQATLRVIERFRFTPAKVMGTPVPVRVTIPIQWTTVG